MAVCTSALAVKPPTCPIPAEGGISKHTLTNQSDRRLAFLVKLTNDSNYSVSVKSGFVDVGKTLDFTITRIKGKPKVDKLSFLFADASDSATDPNASFPGGVPKGEVTGETVVKLSAAE